MSPTTEPTAVQDYLDAAVCACGAKLTFIERGGSFVAVDADGQHMTHEPHPVVRDYWDGGHGIDWDRMAVENINLYGHTASLRGTGAFVYHTHSVSNTYSGRTPVCCEQPMRLVPSGWLCRATQYQDGKYQHRRDRAGQVSA